jgi:hypothetical protein
MGHTREVWGGNDGAAVVEFDEQGRINQKMWAESPDSLRGKLGRWLPWIESRL